MRVPSGPWQRPLSMPKLVARRLADDWRLLLAILAGSVVAATLVASAPVYLKALERVSVRAAVDQAPNRFLNIVTLTPHVPLNDRELLRTDRLLGEAIGKHLGPIYRTRERYLKAPTYLVGLPRQPLPDRSDTGDKVSRGYFQCITNLEGHVRFLAGRMANDRVESTLGGIRVEAVVGRIPAEVFDLQVGDEVVLTPSLGDPTRITAKVVGILEPADPEDEYWQYGASIFINPEPLDEVPDIGVEVDPEEPPLALFIAQGAFTRGVGRAYPGTLVSSTWFVFVDREALKGWTRAEMRRQLALFEAELSNTLPGSVVITGIKRMVRELDRESFFSGIPLLLLLTIMVATVLYFLGMMVSYLVQSREADVALLRSRGVSTGQVLKLYALEGAVLTAVSVALAPFLAMGLVAVAGRLPYFQEITGGGLLPVELRPMPFLVALLVGAVAAVIFVVPGVVGARSGLVVHKLRSSRPPAVPIFQRYYLDVLLMVLGGVIFWELYARGKLVSGGLFKGVEVNEALLLAPVLFLTVVALLFMRLFPLFVKFIGGESPALLHLVAIGSLGVLATTVATRDVLAGRGFSWVGPVTLLALVAWTYWSTGRARRRWVAALGLALQAGLVAWFFMLRPPEPQTFIFGPQVALMALVPGQVVFLALRALMNRAPVWVSMSLWHMARNPLQYSWLVLLLVLVTGLGVLATTVGDTLDRSYRERVTYDVGADIRITDLPGYFARTKEDMRARFLAIPGITTASLAFRAKGSMGASYAGGSFEVLAVESQDFPYIAWYREDFSDKPLGEVMRSLQSSALIEPVEVPEETRELRVWVKPADYYPNVFLWAVVQDHRGIVRTLTFGELGPPEWHQVSTRFPPYLKPPIRLISLQIFEPVFGPAGTPGALLLDGLTAVDADGSEVVLEDFEGPVRWVPLATSALSSDVLTITGEDTAQGDRAGLFVFGKDTDRGIRGLYYSPSGDPIPVVASSSLLEATGARVGDTLIVNILGRFLPVVIRERVDYFPTMNPRDGGFLVADLDTLLTHINIISPATTIMPNEVFMLESPRATESVRKALEDFAAASDRVKHRRAQLEALKMDPLIAAGWRAMAVLALGVILFTAGLGYIIYLLAYADRGRSEMGYLQSLGLSRDQVTGLLALEHLLIVLVGLGLGSWAGFQMSSIMVASVSVTETGEPVVPPFVLMTDWGLLVPVYLGLLVIFGMALLVLNRSMARLDLQAISRAEGY